MRLITFEWKGKLLLGCQLGDCLLQLDRAYEHWIGDMPSWLGDMRALLAAGETALAKAKWLETRCHELLRDPKGKGELTDEGVIHKLDEVRRRAPIRNPEKIICIGLNYRDHCAEQKIPLPQNPILFSKFSNAIIGPGDKIRRPRLTNRLDFEGELALVIGREGMDISRREAMDYVAGYTIFNDVSARDIQFADRQWLRGKTFDTFAPMGPTLVTKDEVGDPQQLAIKVKVNGRTMQDSTTANMIFDIPYLISFISQVVPLSPGDVVATGTPAGVGAFRKPPVFLQEGDEVSIEIEKLGLLRNAVIDEGRQEGDIDSPGLT